MQWYSTGNWNKVHRDDIKSLKEEVLKKLDKQIPLPLKNAILAAMKDYKKIHTK